MPQNFTINTGEVSAIPAGLSYPDTSFKRPTDNSVWGDYKLRNHYIKDGRTWMMGVTAPPNYNGDTAAFVQLAMPTLLWICEWTALRSVTRPLIPNPTLVGSEWVLLDEYYAPFMIGTAVDQITPLYRIAGRFVYGHKRPSAATIDNVRFPLPPWLDDVFNRTVTQDMLAPNLSTPDQTPATVTFGTFIQGNRPTQPAAPGVP